MKYIILSADGDSKMYSVPDVVADDLHRYCVEFADKWLRESPDASKYRTDDGVCYNEDDFIDYLNQYLFPNKKSTFVQNLGWTCLGKKLPGKYRKFPYFNF